MSKVLRELECGWGEDSSCVPEHFQPFVAFLKEPERGLPVISGVTAWLKAVKHWTEAARFLDVLIQFTGVPLLGAINYNYHLNHMSPRYGPDDLLSFHCPEAIFDSKQLFC